MATKVVALIDGLDVRADHQIVVSYGVAATDGVNNFKGGLGVVVPVDENTSHINDVTLQAIADLVANESSLARPDTKDIFFTHLDRG